MIRFGELHDARSYLDRPRPQRRAHSRSGNTIAVSGFRSARAAAQDLGLLVNSPALASGVRCKHFVDNQRGWNRSARVTARHDSCSVAGSSALRPIFFHRSFQGMFGAILRAFAAWPAAVVRLGRQHSGMLRGSHDGRAPSRGGHRGERRERRRRLRNRWPARKRRRERRYGRRVRQRRFERYRRCERFERFERRGWRWRWRR